MSEVIAPHHTIAIRIEKLRFLTEELVLAGELINYATHSDMARMLARHVAIRIPDFIGHTRQLRNCLDASPASSRFKETVNVFSAEFDAHIAIVRHKLGAHVQDIDFVQRIELWGSIDSSKVDYFVQGARELWDALEVLDVPGHRQLATPWALADPGVASVLEHLASEVAIPLTFGTDALASARANSHTLSNGTPVHQRAGQLALLRRWLRAELELFAKFKPYAPLARILKARLLTDIVSFHDCLITRPIQPGAPQEMAGLDELIAAEGASSAAIRAFAATNRDDATINPIRHLRNCVGGHFDIDPTVSLAALIAELDRFDLNRAMRHFAALESTFVRTCRQVYFLTAHLLDGQEVGGTLVTPGGVAPFDPARPDIIAPPPSRPTYTIDEMQAELERWAGGAGPSANRALDYFRDAFSHASQEDTRVRVERLGSSQHFHHLTIRSSHLFIRDALTNGGPEEEEGLLALVSNCPGFPSVLADVLVEYHRTSGRPASPALLATLGRLAPWWLEDARAIVEDAVRMGSGADRLLARAVLLRIYLREEGPTRANRRPSHVGWPDVKKRILADVPAAEDLATYAVLASAFIGKDTGGFIRQFDSEYRELADGVLAAAQKRLAGTLEPQRSATLQRLVDAGHFAQAVQCIVTTGQRGHAAAAKDALLQAFGRGLIETGRSVEEGAAVAECLLALEATGAALEVLERLSREDPGNVEHSLRIVEILTGLDGMAEYGRAKVREIRDRYVLEASAQERLDAIERELTDR